jgi:hypothetical protein
MKSVVIIADRELDLVSVAERFKGTAKVHHEAKRLVIEMADGWFAIERNDRLKSDFDLTEFDQVKTVVKNPHFFVLEFRTLENANAGIQALPEQGTILVDNDCGTIAPLSTILKKRKKEDWTGQCGL